MDSWQHSGPGRSWSRRCVIGAGIRLGAGLALSGALGTASAWADPAEFDADVGIDPGHSPLDVGTSGAGVGEYQHTLDVALRLKPLLEEAGLRVALTRTEHVALSPWNHPNPTERIRIEQSARIAAVGNARIYVSLHFDGLNDPSVRGTETFYNTDHGDDGRRLAEAIQGSLVAEVRAYGHPTVDRGAKSDLWVGKPYGHFFMLRGPMPSVCGEPLFLTNPTEGRLMLDEGMRQAIARGYAGGIMTYFAGG